MILRRRRHGSQRALKPIQITMQPNWGGQGGAADLTFQDADGMWYTIQPETAEDVRALVSLSHVVQHNFRFREPEGANHAVKG